MEVRFDLVLAGLNFIHTHVSMIRMNQLPKYGDRVKAILDELKSGRMSMAQGAVQLQIVATLAEQDAEHTDHEEYKARLILFADRLYRVIEKMIPERTVMH
ncbi:hypothetical protein [Maridesulfovibrio sp.]|uniref:hypothetical protein n=1 Tax=Maridesulfovibrio sp. TaxID=2795000 RepID=UPI0039F0B5BE